MRIREGRENPEKRNLEIKEIQANKYPNVTLQELIRGAFREEKEKMDCAITSAFLASKLLRLQQRRPGGYLQLCLGGGEGG